MRGMVYVFVLDFLVGRPVFWSFWPRFCWGGHRCSQNIDVCSGGGVAVGVGAVAGLAGGSGVGAGAVSLA